MNVILEGTDLVYAAMSLYFTVSECLEVFWSLTLVKGCNEDKDINAKTDDGDDSNAYWGRLVLRLWC